MHEVEDRRNEAETLFDRALAWERLGDRSRAIEDAAAALALKEQIDDPSADRVRQQLAAWRAA